jgi:hypothetical protein
MSAVSKRCAKRTTRTTRTTHVCDVLEGFGAKIEATLLEGAEAEGRVEGQPVAHADKGAGAQLPAELSVERERHDPVLRVEEAADHIAGLPSPLLASTLRHARTRTAQSAHHKNARGAGL